MSQSQDRTLNLAEYEVVVLRPKKVPVFALRALNENQACSIAERMLRKQGVDLEAFFLRQLAPVTVTGLTRQELGLE